MSNFISPISWLPQEMLQYIRSFNPLHPARDARINHQFHDAHTDLLIQNIGQIFEQCSTGPATLGLFINSLKERCRIAELRDDYSHFNGAGVNHLHQLIVQKIQSFGIACPNTYLSPQEIHRYSADIAAVEDLNLQRAWDAIRRAVMATTPFWAVPLLNLPAAWNVPAAAIRVWMDGNIAALQRILFLDLSKRRLTCIPREISLLTRLQRLDLSDNNIKELPVGIFSELLGLQRLDLSGNNIKELPVEIFSELLGLQRLDLSNNKIRELPVEIFNGLVGLQRLFLGKNEIRELPVEIFNELVGLQRLDLRNNQIRELPVEIFNRLIELQGLYLNNNQIEKLPVGIFNGLARLQGLYLYSNQIRELPVEIFNGLIELQGLYINNNQISELPVKVFNGLVKLQRLYLNNNQIRELSVGIFNELRLQRLDLNDNQIRELSVGIFDGLVWLQELYLYSNQIRELPVEIFNGLVELQKLSLHSNQIRELPVEIFNGLVGLQKLRLYDNPRLLVFYEELRYSCKNHFDAFHQYICKSAFARFYQFAAQGHPFGNVIDAFHNLDQTTKNAIYGMVYKEAGRPITNDLQWGEHHAFDDKGIFNGALKLYVRGQFNALSESQKNAVYERVRELAQEDQASIHEDFSDPNWGRKHAKENLPRLIDAIIACSN